MVIDYVIIQSPLSDHRVRFGFEVNN
uniref:Uncharacterized protein n=1 Tax=Rhizophora mucronata TaxID=61149 RepID=A0A2P2NFX6_RHIMU